MMPKTQSSALLCVVTMVTALLLPPHTAAQPEPVIAPVPAPLPPPPPLPILLPLPPPLVAVPPLAASFAASVWIDGHWGWRDGRHWVAGRRESERFR